MKLYKYMSADFGLEVLKTRKIKVSTILDANDPNEWRPVCPDLKNGVDDYLKVPRFRAQFRYLWAYKYGFISLSSRWDNIVMWGHYADKCRGVVVEFTCKEEVPLQKIDYTDIRYVLDEAELCSTDTDKIERLVARKAKAWEYEKEYRLLVDLRACTTRRIGNNTLFFSGIENAAIRLSGIMLGPESTVTLYDVHDAMGSTPPIGFESVQLASDSHTYGIVACDHKVWNGTDWIGKLV